MDERSGDEPGSMHERPHDGAGVMNEQPGDGAGAAGTITIAKLNWRGERVYAWHGDVVSRTDDEVLLRAVWRGPGSVQVAPGLSFEPGDVFDEYYYFTRPYGLWRVLAPDERTLKCWYCNVSTPAVLEGATLSFRDLLLDVLLLPGESPRVLDRDDLERARAEGLDPALGALAEQGAGEILGMIARGEHPFD